jgi:hypothetical protein
MGTAPEPTAHHDAWTTTSQSAVLVHRDVPSPNSFTGTGRATAARMSMFEHRLRLTSDLLISADVVVSGHFWRGSHGRADGGSDSRHTRSNSLQTMGQIR